MEPYDGVASQYVHFAEHCEGQSPCFVEWGRGVAADPEVLAWIDGLPGLKKQPNLVFAAARWHGVPAPGPYAGLREALLGDDGSIRATILARATQTNEVGRLATLVPAFAQLSSGPIALIEVGASAGLNLFPDRYSYSWGGDPVGTGPLLTATVAGDPPLPSAVPAVAWRGGIDLNPLDVTDPDQMGWLTTLVWPEHDDRRAQLVRAIEVARQDPPVIVKGDLLEGLPVLVEKAAEHGPVVVFHSAVIVYLAADDRARFHELMTGLVAAGRCHWVSNEAANVLPDLDGAATVPVDPTGFVMGI